MPTRQDVAIGLSLATLWFIGVWSDLLPFLYLSSRFPVGALPCWQDFLAVLLNVCLLGAAFAVGRALIRRAPHSTRVAAGWAFLVSLIVPLNVIRNHFHPHMEPLLGAVGPIAARTLLAQKFAIEHVTLQPMWAPPSDGRRVIPLTALDDGRARQ